MSVNRVQQRINQDQFEAWLETTIKDNSLCPECESKMETTPTKCGAFSLCLGEKCGYYYDTDYDPDPTYDVRVRH